MAAAMYSLVVRCDSREKDAYKGKLRRLGLRWDNDAFYGCVKYRRYKQIDRYCDANGLMVKIDSGFAKRSGNYRNMFFKYHEPQIGKYYLCSYCGRLLKPEKVTVDHLYPIKKSRDDPKTQHKLRKMGLHDVNDPKNLVAACEKCNAKKAAKTGKWIFWGKIGQSTTLWIIRKIIRACLIALAIYVLYRIGALREMFEFVRSCLQDLQKVM